MKENFDRGMEKVLDVLFPFLMGFWPLSLIINISCLTLYLTKFDKLTELIQGCLAVGFSVAVLLTFIFLIRGLFSKDFREDYDYNNGRLPAILTLVLLLGLLLFDRLAVVRIFFLSLIFIALIWQSINCVIRIGREN